MYVTMNIFMLNLNASVLKYICSQWALFVQSTLFVQSIFMFSAKALLVDSLCLWMQPIILNYPVIA